MKGMSPYGLFFDQTLAVSQRLLLEQWRQRRGLIFWAAFPAAMMLLFGLVYAHNANMRAGLDAAAAGILIGAALFFSCLGGTVSIIAAERERRTLRRLLASPLHPAAYFLGVVLAQMVLAAVQVVMLYSIAWFIGARYHGNFLLGGLMDKLIYLTKGLAVILGFIGVKLIVEALHGGDIHKILGVEIPEISTQFSLLVIVGTLLITTIASLFVSSKSKLGKV